MLTYPRLAADCSFHAYDNAGGDEEYVLATPDGRQFKVSGLARRILARLDGETTIDQLAAELNQDSVPISPAQLRTLLEEKYGRLGVVVDAADPKEPVRRSTLRRRPGFPMLLTLPLVPQRVVALLSRGLQYLYAPLLAMPLLGLVGWTHLAVYSAELDTRGLTSESYLWITVLCLLSILIHELGHAAAVLRFGGTPGTIGMGLYFLLPTFFADVSQLWRFPRKQRMIVDLGGAYFQQLVYAAFALIALRTGSQELLASCHLIDVMVLMALNPLFHFDGYWFLADYLALPKLQKTAFQALGSRLRRFFGFAEEAPRLPPMHPLARTVFWSYSALASVFLVAVGWLIYQYLSSTLLRLPTVAPEAFTALTTAFQSGDAAQILVRLMAIFFLIAFPATAVVGLSLYLSRLGRLCVDRLHPLLRKSASGG